jgi:CheY-like chemotaxis protein
VVGATVLVVDDEPALRRVATRVLTRHGFEVLTAEDGLQAVQVMKEHRGEVDCVLCDVTMPRMNGWETLTAVRALEPGCPIILASGYSEAEVMKGDHPEVPEAFLSKPFESEALVASVRRVLGHP